MRILNSVLVLVMVSGLVAQGENVDASGGHLLAEQAWFDVAHYGITLRVNPKEKTIEGSLLMRAKALEEGTDLILHLDAPLEVRKVTWGDQAIEHGREGGLIRMTAPKAIGKGEEFSVLVEYGGPPRAARNAPWQGGFTWSQVPDGETPWIGTSCQGEGADLWWPCKDHPSDRAESMDINITVPEGLYCATNGVLKERKLDKDKKWETFRWQTRVPTSNYCVSLNIAPYEILETEYESVTGEKFPAMFYILPRSRQAAEKAFPHFLEHLRFMEEVCGPYPFRSEKYGVAETPYLGMEHQTIIAYGNRFRLHKDGYDWLHHHEMSHEWWGNLVKCRDWKDMWIHEGIGTYMQALFLERLRGRKAYLVEMRSKSRIFNRRALAPKEVTDSRQIYFGGGGSTDIYNKGSWLMHTLRWEMGDENFFKALRRMAYPDPAMEKITDGSCSRFSDTEEIRAIAEKVHGKDLKWFFDVYAYQPHLPALKTNMEATSASFEWEVPGDLPFPMDVPVVIDGELHRVETKDGKGTITFKKGAEVEVDPDRLILKQRARRGPRRGGR